MYPQSLLKTNEIVFKAVLDNLMAVKPDFLKNYDGRVSITHFETL